MTLYKLFRVRKDGSLGPLFMDARLRIPMGKRLQAKRLKPPQWLSNFRPGWHCCAQPCAPHLKLTPDRKWFKVAAEHVTAVPRPAAQGEVWYLARVITVVEEVGRTNRAARRNKKWIS